MNPTLEPPVEGVKSPPHYQDESVTLHHGDCLEVLRRLPDASVDAVVTDPPYGLEFMGKEWDSFGGDTRQPFRNELQTPDNPYGRSTVRYAGASSYGARAEAMRSFQEWCEAWSVECLRVLKPGGHMLAFGGTRTWHRLAVAVEDAGFEVRDSLAWLYGSGFPKSLNLTDDDGERTGWGTALKPAFEPIVMGRKPLAGTVSTNVLAHGTGALNINGCRVGFTSDADKASARPGGKATSLNGALAGKVQSCETTTTDAPTRPSSTTSPTGPATTAPSSSSPRTEFQTEQGTGRWPANVILDESQAAELDEQSGTLQSGANPTRRSADGARDSYGEFKGQEECDPARGADAGGASRFFYVAKADQSERVKVNGIAHPTVKPLAIMRWLVRLVTPPGGTVLEPFAGSGTTVEACILEGFQCIAVEREGEYLPLIVQRINRRRDPVAAIKASGDDGGLFDLFGGVA